MWEPFHFAFPSQEASLLQFVSLTPLSEEKLVMPGGGDGIAEFLPEPQEL